ncbi:MAG: CsbD family protein [Terriglobia bacterium]
MKPSTKNKLKGKLGEVKGKIKVKTGQLIKNRKLEAQGRGEIRAGKARQIIGKAEKVVGF